MSWAFEGIECYVSRGPKQDHAPLYRAWNGSDHFYTMSKPEYNGLPASYQREGIACHLATARITGHAPLYRLYRGANDDHFYCISPAERDNAVNRYGYQYEGIAGYVMPTQSLDHVPFYRAYNPEIGDHFYTINVAEIDNNGPTLSDAQLRRVLNDQLGSYFDSGKKIYLADSSYFCPTEKVAQEIINDSKVDQRRYISEIFDCDDFAHLLKAAFIEDAYVGGRRTKPYAMGIIWGSKPAHAMNFLVISDGASFTVKVVEPQNGKMFNPSARKLDEIYLAIG